MQQHEEPIMSEVKCEVKILYSRKMTIDHYLCYNNNDSNEARPVLLLPYSTNAA